VQSKEKKQEQQAEYAQTKRRKKCTLCHKKEGAHRFIAAFDDSCTAIAQNVLEPCSVPWLASILTWIVTLAERQGWTRERERGGYNVKERQMEFLNRTCIM
jgi:hypothetical protein